MKYTILIALFLVSLTANAQSDTVAYWFSRQLFERDSARWDGFMAAKKTLSGIMFQQKTLLPEKPKRFTDWVVVYRAVTCESAITVQPLTIEEVKSNISFPKESGIYKSLAGLCDVWYLMALKDGKQPNEAAIESLNKLSEKLYQLGN